MKIKRIAVTPGEPAGIGPDLLVALSQFGNDHELVVIADPVLLRERAKLLGLPLQLRDFDPTKPAQALQPSELCICEVPLNAVVEPGEVNAENAGYVLATLDKAIELCQQQLVAAMVTAPVHKGVINDAGISFSGHTEYLADQTQTDHVVMMLATKGLRVALATTHLPLAEVPAAITEETLTRVLRILNQSLRQRFGIRQPRILVCGLNPHAGEGGHMGREEIEVIEPVLESLRENDGMNLIGPLPADTLFTPKVLQDADAVLAMYHDQGLPVLKYKGFGNAVNITLGLPIIRTSVDHGTALDLVGTGKADTGSLRTAITVACEMAGARA